MSKRDAKFRLNYFTGTVLPSRYACSCCGRDYRGQVWSDRLDYLQSLQPGWLDGAGSAVSRVAIQTAESFLFMVFDAGLDKPGIFPTRDGGIQMEWAGVEDLEVVVSGGGQVRLFHDDLEDDSFHNLTYARLHEAIGNRKLQNRCIMAIDEEKVQATSVEVLAKELDPEAWEHGLNETPFRVYNDLRSSEEIWEERRSRARDKAKKIIQNLIDVGREDSPIMAVGDCGQSMIQCLIELESDRRDRVVGSKYDVGFDDGWENALDMLRSILIGHGINLKEES